MRTPVPVLWTLGFYMDNIKSKNEAVWGKERRREKEEEKGIDTGDVYG